MDDVMLLGAGELAQAIADGRVSSLEVVEALLARTAEVNPVLRAVVAMDPGASRAAARAADDAVARGEAVGPLHGVPFTVKDWIETHDLPCAAGMEARRDYIPKRDATAVARLRAAGAILLGKTKPGTDGAVYPRARNPYDLTRTTGGSSAGEAAIVAARGSPFGLGSDSGGSLRFPAHCCGIATLKPSAGLVPVTGHFPRVGGLTDPRTQIGPMARSVSDLALVLRVIAGPDGRDPAVAPVALGDYRAVKVAGLRVAVVEEVSGTRPSPEMAEAVRASAEALAAAGAEVALAKPPRIDEAFEITKLYWRRAAFMGNPLAAPGSGLKGDESAELLSRWDRLVRDMTSWMDDWDAILTPAAPYAAPLAGDEAAGDFVYTLPFSLTGWPCVVVRAGTSAEGLPLGVQLVARRWRDDVALAAGSVVEGRLGGWQAPAV